MWYLPYGPLQFPEDFLKNKYCFSETLRNGKEHENGSLCTLIFLKTLKKDSFFFTDTIFVLNKKKCA